MQGVFKKPNLFLLKGKFVCDTHCHSRYTDGFSSPFEMRAAAVRQSINLAMTDHNDIRACRELKDAENVLPGIEVHSRQGPHILVYFARYSELADFYLNTVQPNHSKDCLSRLRIGMHKILEGAKNYNGVCAVAHPAGPLWLNFCKRSSEKDELLLDAVEVISGMQSRNINRRAFQYAADLGLSTVAGSDAHHWRDVGRVVTYSDATTREEFLEDIRKGRTQVIGTEAPLVRRPRLFLRSFRSHIKYRFFDSGKQFLRI